MKQTNDKKTLKISCCCNLRVFANGSAVHCRLLGNPSWRGLNGIQLPSLGFGCNKIAQLFRVCPFAKSFFF